MISHYTKRTEAVSHLLSRALLDSEGHLKSSQPCAGARKQQEGEYEGNGEVDSPKEETKRQYCVAICCHRSSNVESNNRFLLDLSVKRRTRINRPPNDICYTQCMHMRSAGPERSEFWFCVHEIQHSGRFSLGALRCLRRITEIFALPSQSALPGLGAQYRAWVQRLVHNFIIYLL